MKRSILLSYVAFTPRHPLALPGGSPPVEYVTIPSAYMMTSRALATMTRNIAGLVVLEQDMIRNLGHPNVLGQTAAERVMMAVYKKTGLRDKAHTLLHRHDAAYFSIAKILELAINNGRCLGCEVMAKHMCPRYAVCAEVGRRLGIETGSLADFKDLEGVKEAYDKQMKYFVDLMLAGINVMDIADQRYMPLPYLSLLVDDCIEKGVDISAGGAKYNFTGPQAVGLGTVADGLAAIKQLVDDDQKISGKEFLQAVSRNWEGYEWLYALHTCVESSLHCKPEMLDHLYPFVDLVITDIKHMDPSEHKRLTGVGNQRILENIKKTVQLGMPLVIRVPIVAEQNDGEENITATAEFIANELDNKVKQVQLIPYRELGLEKYKSLGMEYPMGDFEAPAWEAWEKNIRARVEQMKPYGVPAVAGTSEKLE